MHFNLSHRRGCVAVAIAQCPAGVDVEQRRRLPGRTEIGQTAFAPEAYNTIARTADPAAHNALSFRYWTLGEGVAQGLSTFAFTARDAPLLIRVSAD